jgi:hypothetical protein
LPDARCPRQTIGIAVPKQVPAKGQQLMTNSQEKQGPIGPTDGAEQ